MFSTVTPSNGAVGGDQRQIHAQSLVQRRHVLLHDDLNQLNQHGDDQNEHDGLQVAQIPFSGCLSASTGVSRKFWMGQVTAVARVITKITAQLMPKAELSFWIRPGTADAQELDQDIVIHQNHGEEDSS